MRFITEQALRDAFAKGVPARFDVPPDARLTPAARQYLTDLRVPFAPPAPVRALGKEKPEAMTHLEAGVLVRKDHPRIVLRGKLDTLEAELLLLQVDALDSGRARLASQLGEALLLVRRVLAADFKGDPLGGWTLCGMDAAALRDASHHPERFAHSGHLMPDAAQGPWAARLNRLRALSRETELSAVHAHAPPAAIDRTDIIKALNRLSSFLYILQMESAGDAEKEAAHGQDGN